MINHLELSIFFWGFPPTQVEKFEKFCVCCLHPGQDVLTVSEGLGPYVAYVLASKSRDTMGTKVV